MTARPTGQTRKRSLAEQRQCVAIDLTALEHQVLHVNPGPMQVRFVQGLIRHAPEVDFVLLTRPVTGEALAHLDAANARRLMIADPSPLQSLLTRLQARLSRLRLAGRSAWLWSARNVVCRQRPGVLANLRANVVFCPFTDARVNDPSVPMVAAVHDLQHLSHPHLLTAAERVARGRAFSSTYRRAARVVCSTTSLRDVALQCEGLLPERVLALSPGVLLRQSAVAQPVVAAALARHGLRQNGFFLFAGDFEPRHNHRLILTAFAIFRARHPDCDVQLVCVGSPGRPMASLRAAAGRMGLGTTVHFPGAVPNAELTALTQGCRAIVVVSLYDTVGEAVLEAMALGRPVLCSHVPDLTELTNGAALMFDPHRPADLANAFGRIDGEPAILDRLAQLGLKRVATLDDAQSVAQAYLGVFREVGTRVRVATSPRRS
jgi:glycosyltransferase involved in cell wall biosynthesis